METILKNGEPVHIGHNIRRIREISGKKQYELADACGFSHKQMSRLENSESIDDDQLEVIVEKLGVTSGFIRNFRDVVVACNIQCNSLLQHDAGNIYNNHLIDDVILLENFIQNEQKEIAFIEEIGKEVLDLAGEVKKLKENRN